jgi:predicted Zn finger-like uncharacterized protein
MSSVIACPSCQKQLKVPDEYIGRNVKCPGCKETFTAQVEAQSAPPPAAEEIVEKPRKKPAPPPEEEEDEAPRPAKRRPAEVVDDDEDEERPSRRSRRGGSSMAPHRGQLILILGIASLAGSIIVGALAFFIGPVAWYLGNVDLKAMNEGRMDPEGRGNTQIGKICGIIATVLLILSFLAICIFGVLWIVIVGAAVSNAPKH